MKSVVVACLTLLAIVFGTTLCHSECLLEGSYATVYKYLAGKNKVQEKWECAADFYQGYGNAICFYNYLDNSGSYQTICVSGDFKIEHTSK